TRLSGGACGALAAATVGVAAAFARAARSARLHASADVGVASETPVAVRAYAAATVWVAALLASAVRRARHVLAGPSRGIARESARGARRAFSAAAVVGAAG